MKKVLLLSAIVCVLGMMGPGQAAADQQPEMIAEKMAIKFVRGVANTFTSVAEIPKQIILTGRDLGPFGYVVGPFKGVGMAMYRGVVGMTEAVFCMVPQPGYYDPMIDPEYVWQGWEPRRDTTRAVAEEK